MKEDRIQEIEKIIKQKRSVKIQDLANYFQVSVETIRRDFKKLEDLGILQTVYGGAIARHYSGIEPFYEDREQLNMAEKKAIAQKAVELVSDGDIIGIDIGTTLLEFAKNLVGVRKVTVLTNSLKIASVLSVDFNIKIILLGGSLRHGELSTSGFLAEGDLSYFTLDKMFMGIGGITANDVTDYHIEETNLRRQYIKNAKELIGLVDYSKFGITAMNRLCPTSVFDKIVTDDKSPSKVIQQIRNSNVKVIIA